MTILMRSGWTTVAVVAGLRGTAVVAQPLPSASADAIAHPPVQREFHSPAGGAVLTLLTPARGLNRVATAVLEVRRDGVARERWRQPLPHFDGPRTALVTDSGVVILLDDWINSPSPRAITVLDPAGRVRSGYSYDDLVAILGVSRRVVSEHARRGTWMSEEPRLSADGRRVTLAAGGHTLSLLLATGALERLPAR